MRRTSKVKIAVARLPLRKAATPTIIVAPTAPRRVFPAWIDSAERGVAIAAATSVTPRVRDGLVLRVVGQKKSVHVRNLSHGSGAR